MTEPRDPFEDTSSYPTAPGGQPVPGQRAAGRTMPYGEPAREPRRGGQGWMVAFLVLVILIVAAVLVWLFAFRSSGGDAVSGTLTIAPTVVDFGDQELGKRSAVQRIEVSNDTDEPVEISSIELSGANANSFEVTDETTCLVGVSVGAGDACSIAVRFRPKARKDLSAELLVASGTGDLRVALHGTGTGEAFVQLESTRLDFGAVLVGKTRTLKTKLTNTGNAPLVIEELELGGDPTFRVGSKGTTCKAGKKVKAGGSCVIAVAFRPTETARSNGTLTVRSDAAGEPATLTLRGEGKGTAELAASPAGVDFGEIEVGAESDPETVTIANGGNAATTLSGLAISGDGADRFEITGGTCADGAQLDPGESCTVRVVFSPDDEGDVSAVLVVGGVEIELRGAGAAPSPPETEP